MRGTQGKRVKAMHISTLIFTGIIVAICVLATLPFIMVLGKDAPFVTMPYDTVDRVMTLAGIGPGDVFYDLGSGDGRLVIAAARRGAKAVGIELTRVRIWYSRVLIKLAGVSSRAEIRREDFFAADISDATVVHLYLLTETHEKLKDKFLKELPVGTRVVATGFPIPGMKLIAENPEGTYYGPIRLYVV